jgi:hypothetical protein
MAAAKSGTPPNVSLGSGSVPELEAEVIELRKELAESRIERDIVKKAATYFAWGHIQVRGHEDIVTRLPCLPPVPCLGASSSGYYAWAISWHLLALTLNCAMVPKYVYLGE